MKNLLIVLLGMFSVSVYAQQSNALQFIEKGNEQYRKNEMNNAVTNYKKALDADPTNETALFNLANAYFRQQRQVDAAQTYLSIINKSSNKQLLAKTYYNQGVILSKQNNLEQSINAYKTALRLNPDDKEARENLQKVLLELKKKKQPEKKEDKKQKKPDNQKEKQSATMNPKEVEQRLKLLEQKEKEVQQRVQQDKASSTGGSKSKDW